MTITEGTIKVSSGQRRLLVADVAALPSLLPSGPVDYELREGGLIMTSPTGDDHGALQSRLAAALVVQGDRRGLGKTRTETGLILQRDPDTLYGPDVMFLASRSYPLRLSPERYWETIPNLVIEIRSKNDTAAELDQKVRDYLAAGVELVWVADPTRQFVTVHRLGAAPTELGVNDTLTADEIISGFRLPLVDLFDA
jgi:Uma2 family endonuclease